MRSSLLPLLIALMSLASCAPPAASRSRAAAEPDPAPLLLPPRTAPAHTPMSDLKPLPAQSDAILIKAGSLPLVHLFDQGGRIRILNATTKQTLLDTAVPAGSIISVSDFGILIGRQRRLSIRLNPQHRYELIWDTATAR